MTSWAHHKEIPAGIYVTLAYIVTAVYFITIIYARYVSPAIMLPDETWFLWSTEQKTFSDLYLGFDLAYGGLFWSLLKFLNVSIGPTATSWAFVLFLTSPAVAMLAILNGKAKLISAVFWLGMPMAWWYGKIISPDALNIFILTLSALAIFYKKEKTGFFLLGIAIGIKLNTIALIPCVILLFYIADKSISIKRLLAIIGAGVTGVLVGSPLLILSPTEALQIIKPYSSQSVDHVAVLKSMLFGSTQTWDLITTSGIFHSHLAMAGYLTIAVAGIYKRDTNIIGALIAFIFTSVILSTSAAPLGWYWFPFLTIFYILVCTSQIFHKLPVIAIVASLAIIIGNSFNNAQDLRLTLLNSERIKNISFYKECITATVANLKDNGPIYIRSFVGVENSDIGPVTRAGYNLSVDEALRATTPHDTFIVDSEIIDSGRYPSLANAPRICNGAFAVDPSNK